jgi:hypothetical protein
LKEDEISRESSTHGRDKKWDRSMFRDAEERRLLGIPILNWGG